MSATKLVATQGSRTALNQIRDSIRSGKTVYVGNCSSIGTNKFSLIAIGNLQQGDALVVYPTIDTNTFTVYYLDQSTSTNNLMQFNVAGAKVTYTNLLSSYITNQIVFSAENYQGVTATNYTSLDNREVFKVTLQYSQWEYPIAYVGSHAFNAFDYYQPAYACFAPCLELKTHYENNIRNHSGKTGIRLNHHPDLSRDHADAFRDNDVLHRQQCKFNQAQQPV